MSRAHRGQARPPAGALALMLVTAWCALVPAAALRAAEPDAGADLSGYWELGADSRSVPAAELAAAVTPAQVAAHARSDAYAIRWCNLLGMPFLMDSGRALNLQVGGREVLLYPEVQVEPRHIYLDRTAHINPEDYDPSTNGDSIGHWEGAVLVVDTVGFAANHGLTAIPGGGYRTASSHLLERLRLLPGGQVLAVEFTWSDPQVYARPHRYEFRYHRLPPTFEATVRQRCDPYDEDRARFLEAATPGGFAAPWASPGKP